MATSNSRQRWRALRSARPGTCATSRGRAPGDCAGALCAGLDVRARSTGPSKVKNCGCSWWTRGAAAPGSGATAGGAAAACAGGALGGAGGSTARTGRSRLSGRLGLGAPGWTGRGPSCRGGAWHAGRPPCNRKAGWSADFRLADWDSPSGSHPRREAPGGRPAAWRPGPASAQGNASPRGPNANLSGPRINSPGLEEVPARVGVGGTVYRPAGRQGFLEEEFVPARRQFRGKAGSRPPRPAAARAPARRLEGAKASREVRDPGARRCPTQEPWAPGVWGDFSRLLSSSVPELSPGLPAPNEDPPNIPPVDTRMEGAGAGCGVGGAPKAWWSGGGEKMDRKTKLGGEMVREETAGEGAVDALAHPSTCSCVRSGLSLAPRPARLPTPEAGACHSGSRLRGLPAQVRAG